MKTRDFERRIGKYVVRCRLPADKAEALYKEALQRLTKSHVRLLRETPRI